ncbi:hypothetical protein FGB62_134g03 [Gracilaria domingensis]|nr:hypothetical protein FGB62_134g03 [Gracilaria domingensis]
MGEGRRNGDGTEDGSRLTAAAVGEEANADGRRGESERRAAGDDGGVMKNGETRLTRHLGGVVGAAGGGSDHSRDESQRGGDGGETAGDDGGNSEASGPMGGGDGETDGACRTR